VFHTDTTTKYGRIYVICCQDDMYYCSKTRLGKTHRPAPACGYLGIFSSTRRRAASSPEQDLSVALSHGWSAIPGWSTVAIWLGQRGELVTRDALWRALVHLTTPNVYIYPR
jgi:hypothetical protein